MVLVQVEFGESRKVSERLGELLEDVACGSEEGSYLRLIDFCITLIVIKKRRRMPGKRSPTSRKVSRRFGELLEDVA